ncbi:MAG: Rieske 2Fe-2S domain-containing protein [Gammaproteobacteria bacterium]
MSRLDVVRVCSLSALGDPGAREFFSGEGDWPYRGFVVQLGGELRAYANVCPHKRHPLNMDDDDFLIPKLRLLRCASHGALFEPETGLCVYGPCAGHSLSSLECWVERGDVLVRAPVSA